MLFDLGPKDTKAEFFGRDEEISETVRLLTQGNWIVVLGPRMTGKTSLVKVTLSELQNHHGRKYETLYVNLRGTKSIRGLLDNLTGAISANQNILGRLKKLVSSIDSIHIGPDGLTLSRDKSEKSTSTFLSLFSALDRSGKKYVIALDEVQVLARVSGSLLNLLANVFTSYKNVKFIFTGSEIGLIKALLDPAKSDSPLYGRPPAEIRLKPFSDETSREFIAAGLKECEIENLPNERFQEIASRLDGIAGWLTMFGNFYGVRRLGFRKALDRTAEEGRKIARHELENFLEGRSNSNYMAVLQTIKVSGSRGSSWSEIKRGVEVLLKNSNLNNRTITGALESLVEAEILQKEEDRYKITDPLLVEAI